MRIFKLLSLLLGYPDEALQEAAPEIAGILCNDPALPNEISARLAALAMRIASNDLLDTQEAYVALFDQTRSLSLYLFEHVHGESRDRGQAMVDLRTLYEANGLEMEPGELPDYLPLFLEFLSIITSDEAGILVADIQPLAVSLAQRLTKRRSDYAAVLDAVLALAPAAGHTAGSVAPEVDPTGHDHAWAEEPVLFTAAPVPVAAPAGECS